MMRLASWLLCAALVGCGPPFSGNIATFDEKSEAESAAIQLSHEQIYRRETLLNDRLAESEYLDSLLVMTTQESFLAEAARVSTQRETAFSSATTFQAGIAFDPLAGATLKRSDDIAELDADVAKRQRTILDKRLAQVEEKLDKGEELTPADQTLIDSVAAEVKPAEPISSDEALGDIVKRLSEIAAEPPLVTTASASDANVDTLEAIRRVQAIRAQLRQAKAAVDLDDLHDYEGNGLYRFQYTATVLPGKSKAQMGVAQLTFSPPMLTDEMLEGLYLDWLVHLSYQLNRPQASVRKGCPRQVFGRSLIEATGLAQVEQLNADDSVNPKPCPIRVALPVQHKEVAGRPSYKRFVEKIKASLPALLGLQSKAELTSEQQATLQTLTIEEFRNKLTKITTATEGAAKESKEYLAGHLVPNDFRDILTDPDRTNETKTARAAVGSIYSYQALPFEQTRVSSVTASRSATREIALSIAARLLSPAIGGNAAFGNATRAAAAADAIETTPIVVGFMQSSGGNDPDNAVVGWVFGPEPRVNAESGDIELAHSVRAHSVSAEISLPSWWPSVGVQQETEWIANWHSGHKATSGKFVTTDRMVRLVPNRGDMQAFTTMLIRETIGDTGRFMKIDDVQPFFLSACEGEVTFRIHGFNLWRSTQVYFGGLKATGVRVLPNMEGVEATVDIKKFFATDNAMELPAAARQEIPLTVETRDGSDTVPIPFNGSRTKGADGSVSCSAAKQVASVSAPGRVTLVQLVPSELPACGGQVTFVAKVTQAANNFQDIGFNLDGRPATHTAVHRENQKARSRVFQVKAKLPTLKSSGRTTSLSVTDGEDISLAAVKLAKCDQEAKAAQQAKPKAEGKKKKPKLTARHFSTLAATDAEVTFDISIDSAGQPLREPGTVLALRVLSEAGKPFGWIRSIKSSDAGNGKVKVEFLVKKKDKRPEYGYLTEGPVVEAGLLTLDAAGKVTAAQTIGERFVVYKTGTDPSVAVAEGAELKSAEKTEVTLSFQPNIHTAFPGLATAKLSAKIESQPDVVLVVTPNKIPTSAGTVKVVVQAKDAEALNQHFDDGGDPLPLVLELSSALPLPKIMAPQAGGS